MSGELQAISAACTVISMFVALAATAICLKISQQISQLETRIVSKLADQYVTKEDLRIALGSAHAEPHARKAAHA